MAQIYKVIKPLELSGKTYRLGEEVALGAREAEDLMNKGFLANTRNGFPNTAAADAKNQEQSREPDMKDPKDAAMVADHKARKDEKHAELTGKKAEKETEKNEREAANDTVLAAKRKEAFKLATDLGREDVAAIEAMGVEDLEKAIKEMQSAFPVADVEVAKYTITGKAEYTDEKGNVQGELEIGSVQELPVVIGEKFITEGVAELFDEKPKAK